MTSKARTASVKYLSRNGLNIDKAQYDEYCKDENYVNVRMFDNNEVRVILKWVGLVRNPANYFAGDMPIFQIGVWNYDSTGQMRHDPVTSGKTFSDEDTAIKAYEKFLETWTDSERDDDGKLIEEENLFTPPPPPNLDAPDSDIASIIGIGDDGVGAW